MSNPGEIKSVLARNLLKIRTRMEQAASRSKRSTLPRLVAVTKTVNCEIIRLLPELGLTLIGESRVQDALAKRAEMGTAGDALEWHLIGHLQTNKAGKLRSFRLLHSLDSLRLLDSLERSWNILPPLDALIEVSISGEEGKFGVPPGEVPQLLAAASSRRRVAVKGLMTMAPNSNDPETSRPVFRGLRELRDDLSRRLPAFPLPELSMGMTGDFEVAIEEGATLVRVGTALFQGLPECLSWKKRTGP